MQPGIHEISNDEYHSSEGISRSAVMEFKKTPFHYWHKYINKNYVKPEESAAMKFGSMLHTAILEAHAFDNRYFVMNKVDRRTKEGKSYYDEMLEKNKNKILIAHEEYEKSLEMASRCKCNTQAQELIHGAQYEKSIYWNDPDTGILCKVRPDILHDNFVVDYKTTNDASEIAFQRSVYNYGYYMQAAMTSEAFKHALNKEMLGFIFLAQETSDPYLTAIYQMDQAGIDQGVQEFKSILWDIKKCRDNNEYPGYPTKIISLPNWSVK